MNLIQPPTVVSVSVIIPVHNGAAFLEECLEAIVTQRAPPPAATNSDLVVFDIQVSIYDDASSDETPQIIERWKQRFSKAEGFPDADALPRQGQGGFNFSMISGRNETGEAKGVGFSKNRAIEQSSGDFLCFCDADDVMLPERVFQQYQAALQYPNAIIGSQFIRVPEDSTVNYTRWANSLTQEQLTTQIYSSFGPTLLMPTWFCSRSALRKVPGGFSEVNVGNPEDLIYFYQFLDAGGELRRVDSPLLKYRFHSGGATFSVLEETIRNLRLKRLESHVLDRWPSFSIWNAGKLGRRFYRSLSASNQNKVEAFYDVDARKIQFGVYHALPLNRRVPIRHVRTASAPLVICVKTELTFDKEGPFQRLLDSLHLVEGLDYFFFN